MTQLDIPTAAARLAELVAAAAAAGEDVVIADAAGRPVARLVTAADPGVAGERQFGTFAGRVEVVNDTPAMHRPPEWTEEQFAAARARGYGTYAGQLSMSDDCFAPATDAELREWGLL